tara:strand:- start:28123 stop:28290 length:168 start_codon:yes stop_codon:yes gene_type:complete
MVLEAETTFFSSHSELVSESQLLKTIAITIFGKLNNRYCSRGTGIIKRDPETSSG